MREMFISYPFIEDPLCAETLLLASFIENGCYPNSFDLQKRPLHMAQPNRYFTLTICEVGFLIILSSLGC